ncbi:MAG TPA: tRNA(Ile)-lysidine synthetase, partial [Kocuria sp.]|nr:tRNA(Ile)-lysidine synthetase [Kocuria sp.]
MRRAVRRTLDPVLDAARSRGEAPPLVLLGCSGGADSLALA